jgi:hypothetical protein
VYLYYALANLQVKQQLDELLVSGARHGRSKAAFGPVCETSLSISPYSNPPVPTWLLDGDPALGMDSSSWASAQEYVNAHVTTDYATFTENFCEDVRACTACPRPRADSRLMLTACRFSQPSLMVSARSTYPWRIHAPISWATSFASSA